jgi:hypothetical protein
MAACFSSTLPTRASSSRRISSRTAGSVCKSSTAARFSATALRFSSAVSWLGFFACRWRLIVLARVVRQSCHTTVPVMPSRIAAPKPTTPK